MDISCPENTSVVFSCDGFVQPSGLRWDKVNLGDPVTVGFCPMEGVADAVNQELISYLIAATEIWNSEFPCDIVQYSSDPDLADVKLVDIDTDEEIRLRTQIVEPEMNMGNEYDLECIGSCTKEARFDYSANVASPFFTASAITKRMAENIGALLGIEPISDQSANIMATIFAHSGQEVSLDLGPYDIEQITQRYTCEHQCVIPREIPCLEPECYRWEKINQGQTVLVYYDASTEPPVFTFSAEILDMIKEAADWWNDTVKCSHDIIQLTTDPAIADFTITWTELEPDAAGASQTLVGCNPNSASDNLGDYADPMGNIFLNSFPSTLEILNNYNRKLFISLLAHELGHSLGIPHPDPISTPGTMGYNASPWYQHSAYDIEEIRQRYTCCMLQPAAINTVKNLIAPEAYMSRNCPGCRVPVYLKAG